MPVLKIFRKEDLLNSLLFTVYSMVGLGGLEPPTSRLSGVRSGLLSYKPLSIPGAFDAFGGDEENRTPDPLLARQVLSQLSYTPVCESYWAFKIK